MIFFGQLVSQSEHFRRNIYGSDARSRHREIDGALSGAAPQVENRLTGYRLHLRESICIFQSGLRFKRFSDKKLIKIVLDTRTMKGNQDFFGGAFPAACVYTQPSFLKKYPNSAQAVATAIVRADEWLQTASPAEVAATVPEGYLLGDKAVYEKSFAGVRETISPDGMMPPGAMENCLKFLVEADPKIAADKDKIKLADTWTNEFAEHAKKHA